MDSGAKKQIGGWLAQMDLSRIVERVRLHPRLVGAEDFELCCQHIETEKSIERNGIAAGRGSDTFNWVGLRILQRRQVGFAAGFVSPDGDLGVLIEKALAAMDLSTPDPWFRFPKWREENPAVSDAEPEPNVQWKSALPTRLCQGVEWRETLERRSISTLVFRKEERRFQQYTKNLSLVSVQLRHQLAPESELLIVRRVLPDEPWLHDPNFIPVFDELSRAQKLNSSPRGQILLASLAAAEWLREFGNFLVGRGLDAGVVIERRASSSLLTISDDGTHPGALIPAPFDLEGVPTQRTELVSGGRWTGTLCDSRRAAQLGTRSTGSRRREIHGSWPRVLPSTIVVHPGTSKPAQLLDSMSDGFLLNCMRLVKRVSPTRARFNAMGWRIHGPRQLSPFSEMVLELDVVDASRHIVGVANDSALNGGISSPSILFEEMPL